MGTKEVSYPVGGEDNSLAVQRQPPYTTPLSKNMRAFDVIDNRGRGGTRPGADRSHYTTLGSGNPVRMLNSINQIEGDNFDIFVDSFPGSSLGSHWSVGQFSAMPSVTRYKTRNHASSSGTTQRGAVAAASVLTDLNAVNYRVEMFITPRHGIIAGTYRLHARMDNTTPVSTTDGVIAELTLTAGGAYAGFLRRYVSGVLTSNAFTGGTLTYDMPGWLVLDISNSTTVKVYWRGNLLVTQTVAAATGNRFGFSIAGAAADSELLVDRVRCEYFRTTKYQLSRNRLYAVANGNFYRETYLTEFEQVNSTLSLASDRRLFSAEYHNALVIADSGIILSGERNGTSATTSFTAASISDWAASGVNKYNHALQIISGTGLTAGTFQITNISGGTLTIAGGGTSTQADATWRIVRSPKIYDPSIADVLATGTNGTTNGAGTEFDSASYSDWLVPLNVTASQYVRYKLEVISGTGATPGVYEITAFDSSALTLATSVGASATNIVFRIFRDALNPIVATAGSVPLNCTIVARHLDRVYFAGDPSNPQGWYACRLGVLTDWDFGVSDDDSAAVAGATAEAGTVGEPLVDLCPWHRDKMMFGCRSSMWLLTGDPRGGGALQQVSQTIGLAAQGAWCTGPNNELYFMSRDGIYQVPSDCIACEPTSISREKMPPELMDIGNLEADICMKYDVAGRGVHIYLTYRNVRAGVSHWWFDRQTGGFSRVSIPTNMEPTSIHYAASSDPDDDAVYLGCRDGIVRRYRSVAETDEGTSLGSFVMLGPFRSADSPGVDGRFMSYQVTVPDDSGDHLVTVHPGRSALEALTAAAKDTMRFRTGTSSTRWPKVRAPMFFLKHSQDDRPISFEDAMMVTEPVNERI
jgi:hypothetical protein